MKLQHILICASLIMANESYACDAIKTAKEIDQLLEAKYPTLRQRLAKGATEKDIQVFEKDFNFKFSSDLAKLYKNHDGESEYSSIFGGWRWLPLNGIREQINNFLIIDKDGYSYGYDAHTSIPVLYNDDRVFYIKKDIENSPLYIKDDDYPDITEPVFENICAFLMNLVIL